MELEIAQILKNHISEPTFFNQNKKLIENTAKLSFAIVNNYSNPHLYLFIDDGESIKYRSLHKYNDLENNELKQLQQFIEQDSTNHGKIENVKCFNIKHNDLATFKTFVFQINKSENKSFNQIKSVKYYHKQHHLFDNLLSFFQT
jgi:hypothetical protein